MRGFVACMAGLALTVAAAQSRSALSAQTWPRYNDPYFSLLQPVDGLVAKGQLREAIQSLDALRPQLDRADPAIRSRAWLIRGLILRQLAELPAAEQAGVQARALGAEARHPFLEFDSLMLLFHVASDRGDLAGAAARVAEAVPIADRTGDAQMRLNVRLDQGRVLRARGQGQAALAALDEAVTLAVKLDNKRVHIQALGARSSTRLGLGNYDGALADAQLAYELTTADGMPPDLRGASAFSLAQVLSHIGDLEGGIDLYTDSIEAYTRANLLAGVALATRQRMDVRYSLGDYDAAATDGEKARELFVKAGSAGQEPAVLSRLALIEAQRGRTERTAEYLQLLSARDRPAQPRVRAAIEADLANAALARRDFAAATTGFSRLLEQARSLQDPEIEWRARHGLGRAALGSNDYGAAQASFDLAIGIIERLRKTLPEAGLRADFVAERLGPYEGLIETQLARSASAGDVWVARAFETSERARGRALADLMAEARARLTDPAVAAIRAEEAAFGVRLSSIQRAIADAKTDTDRTAALADLERAEREFDALVVRIRRASPRYAALAHPTAVSSATVAQGLEANEALVSFWIGTERGVAFVVTRSGLTSHQLPGRRTLDRDVARLRSAIAAGQMDVIRQTGAALHQSLFGKVNVAALAHVIVVPDGPLWRAPLAALATGTSGGWLAEKTAVSVVPSASLLSDLPVAGAGAREPALVFGLEQVPTAVRGLRGMYDQRLLPDRRLAFAATEAEAVARLTGTNTATALFVNARADESAFKQATKRRFRVMHVASHALIDDNAPRRSALVLAPGGADDGLLQLNEIANLQLDVDLVVLSTCQSQLGRTIRGEGLESLSRAFILAGGRAVVASIWAVDDRETSRLMPFFYTALRAKSSPAEALRNAQLQMIKSGGTAALPSSWAGFVIMGRGNVPVF